MHLTASEPKYNPLGAPSSIPGSSYLGFGYSSGDPSGSLSDIPTKYIYPVPIIKSDSVPSENPITYPSHVTKKFPSSKPSNMLIKYSSGHPTGDPRNTPPNKPS